MADDLPCTREQVQGCRLFSGRGSDLRCGRFERVDPLAQWLQCLAQFPDVPGLKQGNFLSCDDAHELLGRRGCFSVDRLDARSGGYVMRPVGGAIIGAFAAIQPRPTAFW